MTNKEPGYVYIPTNPSPFKILKTERIMNEIGNY